MTTPEGEIQNYTCFMVLKQNGTEVTGSGGPDETQQWPIQNGKIQGNKITGQVQSEGPLYKVDLTVAGDRITGDVTAEREGQTMKAKIDLTRTK
jgi:hypothetical protein